MTQDHPTAPLSLYERLGKRAGIDGIVRDVIAAHLANAGVAVLLLDIVPPSLTPAEAGDRAARNRFSQGGFDKALKSRPASFFHPSRATLVSVGNFDDDLAKVKDVDIVYGCGVPTPG